jgi:cell division protein ZapA
VSEINVTIAGRAYRMACEDGQEDHLRGLAALVDKSIAEMRSSFGEIGDLRLTVMGAILIADDLGEARRRITELEGELNRRSSGSMADEAALAAGIAAAADRIEQISASLVNDARHIARAGGGGADVLD